MSNDTTYYGHNLIRSAVLLHARPGYGHTVIQAFSKNHFFGYREPHIEWIFPTKTQNPIGYVTKLKLTNSNL